MFYIVWIVRWGCRCVRLRIRRGWRFKGLFLVGCLICGTGFCMCLATLKGLFTGISGWSFRITGTFCSCFSALQAGFVLGCESSCSSIPACPGSTFQAGSESSPSSSSSCPQATLWAPTTEYIQPVHNTYSRCNTKTIQSNYDRTT